MLRLARIVLAALVMAFASVAAAQVRDRAALERLLGRQSVGSDRGVGLFPSALVAMQARSRFLLTDISEFGAWLLAVAGFCVCLLSEVTQCGACMGVLTGDAPAGACCGRRGGGRAHDQGRHQPPPGKRRRKSRVVCSFDWIPRHAIDRHRLEIRIH